MGREFTAEYRVGVAQRILQGESVSKLHYELAIGRNVLYRWRDAYRKEGAAGLQRKIGRPPGVAKATGTSAPKPGNSKAKPEAEHEAEQLRKQVAELERKIGQQALQLDFLQRAFKRVKESSQPNANTGATASTKRSGS